MCTCAVVVCAKPSSLVGNTPSSVPGPAPHLHHQVCSLQSCDLLQFHSLPIEKVDYKGDGVGCTIPRGKLSSQHEILKEGTVSYLVDEGDWKEGMRGGNRFTAG